MENKDKLNEKRYNYNRDPINMEKRRNYMNKYLRELSEDKKEEYQKLKTEKSKRYYEMNKEKVKLRNELNKEKSKKYQKEYTSSGRRKEVQRIRKENDLVYKMIVSIRSRIGNSIRSRGYLKNSHTYEILGCSYEEFKVWIENKFVEGMCWENYGMWQYDHIIPISSATSEEDVIRLNHYTNFQPLWEPDNRKKYNKIL